MRKILTVVVVLVMLFSVPAFGEEIDFSKLTLDELTELYTQVFEEFQSRTEELYAGSLIFEGNYIAGIDIKPGRYQFIQIALDCNSYLTFSRPLDEEGYTWEYFDQIRIDDEATLPLYFTIENGIKLNVNDCYGILIPSELKSKPIWAP